MSPSSLILWYIRASTVERESPAGGKRCLYTHLPGYSTYTIYGIVRIFQFAEGCDAYQHHFSPALSRLHLLTRGLNSDVFSRLLRTKQNIVLALVIFWRLRMDSNISTNSTIFSSLNPLYTVEKKRSWVKEEVFIYTYWRNSRGGNASCNAFDIHDSILYLKN